jgi:hypothetical protein
MAFVGLNQLIRQSPHRTPDSIWTAVSQGQDTIQVEGPEIRDGLGVYSVTHSKGIARTQLFLKFQPSHHLRFMLIHVENWFPNTSRKDLTAAVYSNRTVINRRVSVVWDETNLRTVIHIHGPFSREHEIALIEMEVPQAQYQDPIRPPVQPVDPVGPPDPQHPCR